jgi:hypothetical protein
MIATHLKPVAKPLCLLALAASTPLIAACGSSSAPSGGSSKTATTTAASTATDAASIQSATKASGAYAKAHRDKVIDDGVVIHHPLHGTGGGEVNDDNPGHADTGQNASGVDAGHKDPCALVSRSEAQIILGTPIKSMVEAPLGPTCIYQPAGAKQFVTMAVQSIDLANIKAHIHDRRSFLVGGLTAFCGTYGSTTTFVALPNRQILTVTAPCTVGVRFAAKAVPRLAA